MSKLKKTIAIFTVLFLVVVFYLVDQYVYSWTGWLAYQGGFCHSKLILLSASGKDGFKSLPYPVDLADITFKLKANPNYSVNSTEKITTISRKFDDLDYQIIFEQRTTETIYYQLLISSKQGEKCTTSNFEIYKKVSQMVDEIPLGDKTRRMILSDFSIHYQNSIEKF